MTLAAFASIVLIHLLAAISPGPSFVVAVRTAANDGFSTACGLAFGFGIGAVIWAVAAMAGLAVLFELVPVLFASLKIVGAAFLLFIAFMMWKHAKSPLENATSAHPKTIKGAIRFGLLTFVTNPKPAIFFGAVFVGLVPMDAPLAWRAAIIFAIFLNETIWYVVVARVFSLPRARAAYINAKVWIDRCFGTLIAAFGLKIALT